MKQTRRASFAESLLNVAIGFVVSLVTQLAVFPLFGIRVSLGDNLLIGAAFTVASIARSYAVRRLFEALRIRGVMT